MYIFNDITIGTLLLSFNVILLSFSLILLNFTSFALFFKIQISYIFLISFLLSTSWFLLLIINFIKIDNNYIYILENSSINENLFYKIGSVWSSKEGAFSLWVWLLNINYFIFSNKIIKYLKYSYIYIKPLLIILWLFTIILLFLNNPFAPCYNYINSTGSGITLLLKDILLIIHPPFLYIGYILSSLLFIISYLIIKLKTTNKNIENLFYNINNFSIICLLIGILLGSFWSYQELGWGGFWNWDPVENLALIPLILNISLLHFKSKVPDKFNLKLRLLISVITFLICFISTLFIRSGLLVSIHAFALTTRNFSVFIFGIILYFIGYLALFSNVKITNKMIFMNYLKNRQLFYIGYVIYISLFITLLILFLTSLPYFLKFFFNVEISIGPQIYNSLLLYLILPGLLTLLLYYNEIIKDSIFFILGLICSFILTFYILFDIKLKTNISHIISILLISFISYFIYVKIQNNSLNKKAFYSHLSFSLIIFSLLNNATKEQLTFYTFGIAESIKINNLTIINQGLEKITKDSSEIYYNILYIYKDNLLFHIASPERYFSKITDIVTTKPYIISTPFYDLYIILYGYTQDGLTQLIINYNPNIIWIWISFIFFLYFFVKTNYIKNKFIYYWL